MPLNPRTYWTLVLFVHMGRNTEQMKSEETSVTNYTGSYGEFLNQNSLSQRSTGAADTKGYPLTRCDFCSECQREEIQASVGKR